MNTDWKVEVRMTSSDTGERWIDVRDLAHMLLPLLVESLATDGAVNDPRQRTPLSDTEQKKRRPPPAHLLLDALQDRVELPPSKVRIARPKP